MGAVCRDPPPRRQGGVGGQLLKTDLMSPRERECVPKTTRMNSTMKTATKSKTKSKTKAKTITVRVPVRTYYEHEVDYDEFVSEWMAEPKHGESNEAYERRCVKTWALMTKELGLVHECGEIDEEECFEDNVNPLEDYRDVHDEWQAEVETFSKQVEDEITHIVVKTSTKEVIFPGNRVVKLAIETDNEDEYYAELDDVGVFYYPSTKTVWIQGQVPTFPGNPTLTEDDGYEVEIDDRVSVSKPVSEERARELLGDELYAQVKDNPNRVGWFEGTVVRTA